MPTITACLIVRDERSNLPECLASLQGAVDEVCVVDTGSTDGTAELAAELGARVGHFEWVDDFAAARNAALELATGDWALTIDADERLALTDALRAAVSAPDAPLGYAVGLRAGWRSEGPVMALPRLFQRHPGAEYRGRVHESPCASLEALGGTHWPDSGVRLVHTGAGRPESRARNARLLRLACAELDADPYLLHKLGQLLPPDSDERRALHERLLIELAAAGEAKRARLPWLAQALAACAVTEWARGGGYRAIDMARQAVRFDDCDPTALFVLGELERRAGHPRNAAGLLTRALRICTGSGLLQPGAPEAAQVATSLRAAQAGACEPVAYAG